MEGWIKIHRKILEWQHFQEPNVLAVFMYLLLSANTKDGWDRGDRVTRGQSCATVNEMSKKLKLSRPTVHKAIKKLEMSGEIVRKKVKFRCFTTIRNYAKYQDVTPDLCKDILHTPLHTPSPLCKDILHTPLHTPLENGAYNNLCDNELDAKNDEPYKNNKNIYNTLSLTHAHMRTHEGLLREFFSHAIMVEQFCMNQSIDVETCREIAGQVVNEWDIAGVTHSDKIDAKKHLVSLIKIEVEKRRRAAAQAPQKSKEQVRAERLNDILNRYRKYETYDEQG